MVLLCWWGELDVTSGSWKTKNRAGGQDEAGGGGGGSGGRRQLDAFQPGTATIRASRVTQPSVSFHSQDTQRTRTRLNGGASLNLTTPNTHAAYEHPFNKPTPPPISHHAARYEEQQHAACSHGCSAAREAGDRERDARVERAYLPLPPQADS